MNRLRLLLEARKLPSQVRDEHVREVVGPVVPAATPPT
jgi:hypothetical protein